LEKLLKKDIVTGLVSDSILIEPANVRIFRHHVASTRFQLFFTIRQSK